MIYAIPDIHGRFDLLKLALADIERDKPGKVVFLGDYVDRGPESCQVLDRLMKGPPEGWEWTCLVGNHEEWFIDSVERHVANIDWIQCGGDRTIASYGMNPHDPLIIPNKMMSDHIRWLSSQPHALVLDNHAFVHAYLADGVPIEDHTVEEMTWGYYRKIETGGWNGKYVCHGHIADPRGPREYKMRLALDACAHETGNLMVAVFDENLYQPVEIFKAGERI